MSDLFFNEQNSLNSRPDRSSGAVAHEYLRLPVLDATSSCTPQMFHENVLGFSGMYRAADQVTCPSNQTDIQFFDYSFLHPVHEFSPGVLRLDKPAPHHLSVSEEVTLTRVGETLIPHWRHTITLPGSHSFKKLYCLSQRNHVGSSRLLPQFVIPRLRSTPCPLSRDSTRQADYFGLQWIDGVRPCDTVVEATTGRSGLMPYMNAAQAAHVGDERNHQEIFPSCGLSFARNESLPRHTKVRAARSRPHEVCLRQYTSLGIRDKDVPAVLTTECLNGYNQDWSPLDMIAFNGHVIGEKEVICRWIDRGTSCNDPVKGKDLSAHLRLRHCVTSDSRLYTCLWHNCVSKPMKKPSLERHMKERHVPVSWACPTCEKIFTRESSLRLHFERCPGRVQSFATQ